MHDVTNQVTSQTPTPVPKEPVTHDIDPITKKEVPTRDWVYKRLPLHKPKVSQYPLGRLHVRRKLREKAVPLGLETLGSEARVIVLRDADVQFSPRPEMEALEGEPVDILARLDAERGLIGQAEVEQNIEELRPDEDKRVVTWEELKAVEQQLLSGFTTNQLVRYIGNFEQQQKAQRAREDGQAEGFVRKTLWMPGISDTGDHFEESLMRGYGSDAFTSKQRLVLQLLRHCWQLEVRELVDTIGEVEVEIRPMELELLIKGRQPPLRQISKKLIVNQDEKIEAFRSRGVVRVTAPKEKAEIVVNEIIQALHNVRRQTVDLNVLLRDGKDGDLVASTLKELSRLTETHIRRLPGNYLEISAIHMKPETTLSSGVDVARRLLLTSYGSGQRELTQLGCSDAPESLVAVSYHGTENMSWRDRLQQWVRLISPTPLRAQQGMAGSWSELQPGKDVVNSTITTPDTIENTPSAIEPSSDHPKWSTRTFTSTTATVGHILHSVPSTTPTPEIHTSSPFDLSTSHTTIFRPFTLNLSRFLRSTQLPPPTTTSSLVMKFLPSPWATATTTRGTDAVGAFPALEFNFEVLTKDSEDKGLELRDVLAVTETTKRDVMLPALPLDLRFRQRTTATLRNGGEVPQIREFLEASQLDINKGRLETPPGLTVPIAKHLVSVSGTTVSGTTGATESTTTAGDVPIGEEEVEVQYLFAGLEYRNTLTFKSAFRGFTLRYTSVEGGKADGRRSELFLLPSKTTSVDPEEATRAYVKAAFSLVKTLSAFDAATRVRRGDVEGVRAVGGDGDEEREWRYFGRAIDFEGEARDAERA